MPDAQQKAVPPTRGRSRAEALREAVPDILASAGCALAWLAPAAPGFDLLKLFGNFFALEIGVAIVIGFAGVQRLPTNAMSGEDRRWFVLLPLVTLTAFAYAYAGASGLLTMAWLGGRTLWAQHIERLDTRPPITGLWLVYSRSGTGVAMEITTTRPELSGDPDEWCVPAGQEQKMSAITVALWMLVLGALLYVDAPALGATADYAASVGWARSPLHEIMPAHLAVAAGTLLFAIRALAHFHGTTGGARAHVSSAGDLAD